MDVARRIYALYNTVEEGETLTARTSWSDILNQAMRDARSVSFRDVPYLGDYFAAHAGPEEVVDFLQRAVRTKNIQQAKRVMGVDGVYFLTQALPGAGTLLYFMNLATQVYKRDEKAEPGILFKSIGIETPIATALDDNMEKTFLLYVYESIQRDEGAIPAPYGKKNSGKLTAAWRAWIRRKLQKFLCNSVHVKIETTDRTGCP